MLPGEAACRPGGGSTRRTMRASSSSSNQRSCSTTGRGRLCFATKAFCALFHRIHRAGGLEGLNSGREADKPRYLIDVFFRESAGLHFFDAACLLDGIEGPFQVIADRGEEGLAIVDVQKKHGIVAMPSLLAASIRLKPVTMTRGFPVEHTQGHEDAEPRYGRKEEIIFKRV